MDTCEKCGFAWDHLTRDEVGPRTTDGTDAIVELLLAEPERSLQRPSADRWSVLEYAAHVRDVLLTIRDRLVIGLVEDDPGFKPMYRDERFELDLHRADTPPAIADEMVAAAAMFVRLFDAIEPASLQRTVHYGFPSPAVRTLLWMGQQVVHEVEHHYGDIEENLRVLDRAGR